MQHSAFSAVGPPCRRLPVVVLLPPSCLWRRPQQPLIRLAHPQLPPRERFAFPFPELAASQPQRRQSLRTGLRVISCRSVFSGRVATRADFCPCAARSDFLMKRRFRMSRAASSGGTGAMTGIAMDTAHGSDRTSRSEGLAEHLRGPCCTAIHLQTFHSACSKDCLRPAKRPGSLRTNTSSLLSRTPTMMPSSHRTSSTLAGGFVVSGTRWSTTSADGGTQRTVRPFRPSGDADTA